MPDTRPRATGKSLIELEVRVAHPLRPRDDQDQAEFLRLPRSLWVGAGASSPVFQGRPQSLPFETLSRKDAIIASTIATLPYATCFRTVRSTRRSGASAQFIKMRINLSVGIPDRI